MATVHGVERVGQVEEQEGAVEVVFDGLLDLPDDGFDPTGSPHTELAWSQVPAAAEVTGEHFGGNPIEVLTDRDRPDLRRSSRLEWNHEGREKIARPGAVPFAIMLVSFVRKRTKCSFLLAVFRSDVDQPDGPPAVS